MQIEQLRMFHLAAGLKSISCAAEISHISQPALSQQIQRLENEIGMRLLERSNRGVELTKAGEIVAKYSKHFTSLYENLMQDLANLNTSTKIIRVSSSTVVGVYSLPCTLFKAKELFMNYDFQLTTAFSVHVERMILQGESDIGFIIGKPKSDELIYKRVYTDRVMLLAGYDYAVPDSLNMSLLKEFPLIMLHQESSFRLQVEKYFSGIGRTLSEFNVLFSLDSAESVKSLVLASRGLAFLPYISVKKELYLNQLKNILLDGFDMSYDIYIIHAKDRQKENSISQISNYIAGIAEHTFC